MTAERRPLETCLPHFARHGSYPPRWGWLPKVHAAVRQDPHVFSRPDATVLLAVGSSMVPAMRFWALAFGLIEPEGEGCGSGYMTTARGRWLLDEDGADTWIEEPGTLWLLHWWLLSARPCRVPTFWHLFANWGLSRVSRAELRTSVRRAAEQTGWKAPSDNTLDRDLTALLAMYAPPIPTERAPRVSVEELLSSPFRELNILTFDDVEAVSAYRAAAVRGRQIHLQRIRPDGAPAAIMAYACLDYARAQGHTGPGTMSLAALASAPGGPGRLLLANETLVRRAIERTAGKRGNSLAIVESADGQALLSFGEDPRALAAGILADHYS
ncbi:DUF4007 family protein [Streptomyces sp. NPDC001787]|uniref:DUF4007 family protein n=1 Tax=Streptomyces sp. NPDC001787 TaxID=3154523 RepID=UPI00332107B0